MTTYQIEQENRIRENAKRVGIHEAQEMTDDMVSRPCFNRLPRMVQVYLKRLKRILDEMESEE
jgi:hypothetical protein